MSEKLPHIRIAQSSHTDPGFVAIEELFWQNKPTSRYRYPKERFHDDLPVVEQPSLSDRTKYHIWGSHHDERLVPATYASMIQLFSCPPFIDALDARTSSILKKDVLSHRYSERTFVQDINDSWIGPAIAMGLGGSRMERQQPDFLRGVIGDRHNGSRGRRHFEPNRPRDHGHLDVPNSALAMNVYEMLRIGETLAEWAGRHITDDMKREHYNFFQMILLHGGIWMPDTRDEMEAIADEINSLSSVTSGTTELVERMIRLALPRTSLDYETVSYLLRPQARQVFEVVAQEYGG